MICELLYVINKPVHKKSTVLGTQYDSKLYH